jgi:hypothetical protein
VVGAATPSGHLNVVSVVTPLVLSLHDKISSDAAAGKRLFKFIKQV